MVCKKDVVSWFKGLKSYSRLDLMCSLLNLCVPFELRYLGTCLEHIGKVDFIELRKTEVEANNQAELSSPELQSLSSPQARTRLAVYVSVLNSCNYPCSNLIYKILTKTEDVLSLVNSVPGDETVLEDLLLLYTLAINHPAFSIEQKLHLEKGFEALHEEEKRREALARLTKSPCSQYEPSTQTYQTCVPLEEHLYSTYQITGVTPSSLHPVEHGMVHDGGGGPPIRMAFPPPASYMLNTGGAWTVVGPPVGTGNAPTSDSPRTGSPCSRPGSPTATPLVPHQSNQRPKIPPPRVPPPTLATAPDASIRDVIGKELPKYMTSLQKFSTEHLARMTDDELREVGLTTSAITQLRSILSAKQIVSNGIGPTSSATSPPHYQDNSNKRKESNSEFETRRYINPLESLYASGGQCYSCFGVPSRKGCITLTPHHYPQLASHPVGPLHLYAHHQPHHPLTPLMADLRLASNAEDHSSASDSSSDHSPPDTPAPHPSTQVSGEVQEERLSGSDERRIGHGRSRGIGRNRTNPPGIQSLPRGRGPNPNQVSRRRDMGGSVANGSAPGSATPGTEGSGTSAPGTSSVSVTTSGYFGYMAGPYLRATAAYPTPVTSYNYPSAYFKHPSAPPHYPPPQQYHNGNDIVYQFPPPVPTPSVAAPTPYLPVQPAFSPTVTLAPPSHSKASSSAGTSCFNCGSQSHHALECPDPSMEEVTKQGQYRIDFTSSTFQKTPSGELSDK